MPVHNTRLDYLDGVRGIAALVVVFYHFARAFLPSIVPDQDNQQLIIADTPINLFYNGPFAVIVFLILSGFVVANSAAKNADNIAVTLITRYIRLALPATVSVIFAWALLQVFPTETEKLSQLLPNPWLQATFQQSIPSLGAAIVDGLYGNFMQGESFFNNVLWTMRIELLGSCALYVIYWLPVGRYRPLCIVAGAATLLLTHNIIYLGFSFGALMRERYVAGRLPTFLPFTSVIVGCLLGSVGTGFYQRTGLPHIPTSLMPGNRVGIMYPVAAAMIVYGCLASPSLQRLLSSAGPRFLGRVSFCLYLFHVPLLYTLFAGLYVTMAPVSVSELMALALFFVSTCLALSFIGTTMVDEPVLAVNKSIRLFFRRNARFRRRPAKRSSDRISARTDPARQRPVFREVLGASGLFLGPDDVAGAGAVLEDRFGESGWRDRTAAAAEANIRRWNALATGDRSRVFAFMFERLGLGAT